MNSDFYTLQHYSSIAKYHEALQTEIQPGFNVLLILYYSLWACEHFKYSVLTCAQQTSDYAVYCCIFCRGGQYSGYIIIP